MSTTAKAIKEAYENGYHDGILKGSEIGDATAKRALKERDDDMSRLQRDRLEWMKERDRLRADLKWILVCAEDMFREGDKGHQIAIFAREAIAERASGEKEGT